VTRYILDTDVLINASKDGDPDRSWVLELIRAGDPVAVSAITITELYAGFSRGQNAALDAFLDRLHVVTVTRDIGVAAGSFHHEHARQGVVLSLTDCLIAASALLTGAVIVTRNVKDYPMGEVSVLEP